jgi:hypothetical protein
MRLELGYGRRDRREALVIHYTRWDPPELPPAPPEVTRRWTHQVSWLPLGTHLLARHRSLQRRHWLHSASVHPPRGYALERFVAAIYDAPTPRARRLELAADEVLVSDDTGEPDLERTVLGYVQQLPYVLMAPLERRRVFATGQHVLSADPLDPIRAESELLERIGWVDTVPISPFAAPERWAVHGLRPLFRQLDLGGSRHRYGGPAAGVCLGSLWHRPGPGFVEVRRDAHGRLESELHRPPTGRSLAGAPRWIAAPLRWGGVRWGPRASAARTARLLGARRRDAAADPQPPSVLGQLRRESSPGWSPLFSAVHPVVGDQFVTRSALEATDLGYRVTGVLGHICDHGAQIPPPAQPDIPWASRFGRSRRYVEGPLP